MTGCLICISLVVFSFIIWWTRRFTGNLLYCSVYVKSTIGPLSPEGGNVCWCVAIFLYRWDYDTNLDCTYGMEIYMNNFICSLWQNQTQRQDKCQGSRKRNIVCLKIKPREKNSLFFNQMIYNSPVRSWNIIQLSELQAKQTPPSQMSNCFNQPSTVISVSRKRELQNHYILGFSPGDSVKSLTKPTLISWVSVH